MAFKPKVNQASEVQSTEEIPAPHVEKTPEGVYHHQVSQGLTPYGPQDKVKEIAPTPENSGSKPLHNENRITLVPSELASGDPKNTQIGKPERVSLPEFKVRKASDPPKVIGGDHQLSNVNDMLAAIVASYAPRVLNQAANGTIEALCNETYAALVQAIQLRWGCQRVATTTGQGKYKETTYQLVGQVQAGDRQHELDEEMFAADVAFIKFLCEAQEACVGYPDVYTYLEDRAYARLVLTEAGFRHLAEELARLRGAFAKAEDIQAGGGWASDKIDFAAAKLAKMADRMACLYFVLDHYRPDAIPQEIPDATLGVPTNPVLAHFIASGGYVALCAQLGEAITDNLYALAMQWETAADPATIGQQYKQVLRDAVQVAA